MIKTVSAAHVDAAVASTGNACCACPLAQAFNVTVGLSPGVGYHGFTEHSGIGKFCENGDQIAELFDKARVDGDMVMADLRLLLPMEVELSG